MKNILVILFLIIGFNTVAQPPGYTKRNIRENVISFIVDSTFHVPRYNGTPSGVRSGGYVADGAIAIDTTNHRGYIYSGGAWVRMANFSELSTYVAVADSAAMLANYLRGATAGWGMLITGSQHKTWTVDSFSVASRARVQKGIDSLGALIGGTPTLTQVLTAGNTHTHTGSSDGINLTNNGTGNSYRTTQSSSGVGFLATNSSTGYGVFIQNNSTGIGILSSGSTNQNSPAIKANQSTGIALLTQTDHSDNTVTPFLRSIRQTGITAGNGIGTRIDALIETSSSADTAVQLIMQWQDATHASRKGNFDIKLANAGVYETAMDVQISGIVRVNDNADTLATKAYARSVGGGGGVSSANLPLRISGSTVSADTSVAYDPSLTTNKRTQKLIDSLNAAGWGASSVNYEPWYRYMLDITGGSNYGFTPVLSGTGGTQNRINPVPAAGWMGAIELNLGTSSTAYNIIQISNASTFTGVHIVSTHRFNFGAKVRFEDLSDGTDTYHFIMGFANHNYIESSITEGVWVSYNHADSSGSFVFKTRSGGSTTAVSTGVIVAADTDYEVEITIISGTAYCYIKTGTGSKTLVGQISTNIPTTTNMTFATRKSAGTTTRKTYLGWLGFGVRSN